MAEYRNPTPTVDVILEYKGGIVLIERKNDPPGWALPGGFIDEGEKVETAAVREAKEETGLDAALSDLLYVYSDPGRDSRQHTMSVVFIATARGELSAADDAADAKVFTEGDLPADLAFDHSLILADYFRFKKDGTRPRPA